MQCTGGTGTFSSKSPSPGSLAQGFSPARTPQCWLLGCPLAASNKNRGSASRWGLYLSNRPVTPANSLGRRHLRGPRGAAHTKAPCASQPRDGQPRSAAAHAGREGAGVQRSPASPEIRTPSPRCPRSAHLPSACHIRTPKAGTRVRDAQTTRKKFVLSPRCALNASRPKSG